MSGKSEFEIRYGFHRVIAPENVFPQAAERLDNEFLNIHPTELLIDVDAIHIDSSSFHQIRDSCYNDVSQIHERILEIVRTRGKMHNPVTNSGGMLIGRVRRKGELFEGNITENATIATLVSLSLTPLRVDRITSIDVKSGVVGILGQAVLFRSGIFQEIPSGISTDLFLKVMDVCGAPAHAYELSREKGKVLVLGGAGKSGVLCIAAAKKAGCQNVVACDSDNDKLRKLAKLEMADQYIHADATVPFDYLDKLAGVDADVTISCVNVQNAEMAAVIATRTGGSVCFFSMATNFQRAALGAEGIGADVNLIIGNGYKKFHSEFALNLLKENTSIEGYLAEC